MNTYLSALSEVCLNFLFLSCHDDDIVWMENDVGVGVGEDGVGRCGYSDDDTLALFAYAGVAYALAA